MSYSNNIGNLQQIISPLATPETRTSQANSTQETATSTPATNSSSPATQSQDHASLSATGSVISQALDGDDVRTDKVASLQQAINSGTYNVPSSAIADKLINSLLK